MTVRAGVLLGPLLLAACDSAPTVCPAIGWSNGLTVRVADDRPSGVAAAVALACPPHDTCPGSADWSPGTDSLRLTDGAAEAGFGFDTPDTVVVTVLDAASEPLTTLEASPEWARVEGWGACGGPSEAEVVVPVP